MKKIFKIALLLTIILIKTNVYACGEIDNLTSSVGSVTKTNATNYVISVPEGTTTVKLGAHTNYTWVEGFGPREVSTKGKVELKVDGNACGYGIYTYFVTFKSVAPIVAENTPVPAPAQNNENANKVENIPVEGNNPEGTVQNPNASPLLKLTSLVIKDHPIEFNPNTANYAFTVDATTNSLDITATPENETFTVQVSENAKKLVEGDNIITITLISQDGTTSTYTLTVTKPKELSDNNYLATITIEGYPLNFDPGITDYNIEVKKTNFLYINVMPESSLAKYEVLGNSNLKKNSVVTIRVTAENGATRDYKLHINFKFSLSNYWIYIVIASLVILLIVLLIINKKMKNRKKVAPASVEVPTETAGVIPTTVAPAQADPITPKVETAPAVANVTLQMIEPTDVVDDEAQKDNNDNGNTEVFQL